MSAYNACRSALSFEPAKERCAKLAQVSGENFCCEQHAAPGSPGVVSDDEYLNFLLFDPQQVFPDKTLRPEGLVQIDRAGLSVLRDDAADEEFLLTMEQLHSNGKQREFHGVARFQAGSIRHLGDERSLGVYDTPLPGKINHCDIIARHIPHGEERTRREAENLRKQRIERIIECIGPAVVEAADFRDGKFATTAAADQ